MTNIEPGNDSDNHDRRALNRTGGWPFVVALALVTAAAVVTLLITRSAYETSMVVGPLLVPVGWLAPNRSSDD